MSGCCMNYRKHGPLQHIVHNMSVGNTSYEEVFLNVSIFITHWRILTQIFSACVFFVKFVYEPANMQENLAKYIISTGKINF